MKKLVDRFTGLLKLIKLETMTMAGRINLAFVVILVLFVIAYTTNDMLCYLISAVRDALKTIALGQDVSDPYITVSIFKLMIPVVILCVLCLGFLHINESAKKKIDDSE